jgi:hypothetical protein
MFPQQQVLISISKSLREDNQSAAPSLLDGRVDPLTTKEAST